MDIKELLMIEMNRAAKERDKIKLSTIRLLRASIKNKEIDKGRELNDSEIIETITSQIKQRKESIVHFNAAGRDDLVKREQAELEVLYSYLPRQLTEEELREKIRTTIKILNASSQKDIGRVMKVLMADISGQTEGKLVAKIVKSELSN